MPGVDDGDAAHQQESQHDEIQVAPARALLPPLWQGEEGGKKEDARAVVVAALDGKAEGEGEESRRVVEAGEGGVHGCPLSW